MFKVFSDKKYKEMSLLEIGCCRGMSTKVYAELFGEVHAYDRAKENVLAAKDVCIDNYNVNFCVKDVYENEWDFPKTDVVVIDAGHDYNTVCYDIDRVIKNNPEATIVMDDYGNPKQDIKRAINEKVEQYKLRIDEFIGEGDGFMCVHRLVFNDREGVVINLK